QAISLGPGLGQCCGGAVTLVWERFDAASLPGTLPFLRRIEGDGALPARMAERAAGAAPRLQGGWLVEAAPLARRPLWIWGAGHVGRALVGVLAPLPDFAITWVDTGAERFPEALAEGVRARIAADPVTLLPEAPETAEHLVLTYSHELDLALCHGLLMRGFGGAGLIGSATKWARFRSRLQALGHRPEEIARIACPIGDPALGKHPQAVALGVAAVLLAAGRRAAAQAG
ncbi:MAG: xanthine dehydrogenase accessory protein XdhC, partial [Rubellimicrobium sp.]|nr:xanthine dehydrogenase accessory protein XdhC [Rubellimicrobium sp.]